METPIVENGLVHRTYMYVRGLWPCGNMKEIWSVKIFKKTHYPRRNSTNRIMYINTSVTLYYNRILNSQCCTLLQGWDENWIKANWAAGDHLSHRGWDWIPLLNLKKKAKMANIKQCRWHLLFFTIIWQYFPFCDGGNNAFFPLKNATIILCKVSIEHNLTGNTIYFKQWLAADLHTRRYNTMKSVDVAEFGLHCMHWQTISSSLN